jgi:hypothetical protein
MGLADLLQANENGHHVSKLSQNLDNKKHNILEEVEKGGNPRFHCT